MALSARLRRFNASNLYRASGTAGRSFCAKSTSHRLVKDSTPDTVGREENRRKREQGGRRRKGREEEGEERGT